MKEPHWAKLAYDKIDYQDLCYYSAPKQKVAPKSLSEVDKELLETYEKLGIPLKEQEVLAGVVAVDAVFDSVSVATTYRAKLAEKASSFVLFPRLLKNIPTWFKNTLVRWYPIPITFCLSELGRIYRRVVCVYSQRRPLSDGIVNLFPH